MSGEQAGMQALGTVGMCCLLFFISTWKSCQEWKYRISAKTVETSVTKITEIKHKGRVRGYNLVYRFTNENSKRTVTGMHAVSPGDVGNWSVGDEISVEYIGGKTFSSRRKGSGSLTWPVLMILFFLGVVGAGAWLFSASSKGSKKVKKSRGK